MKVSLNESTLTVESMKGFIDAMLSPQCRVSLLSFDRCVVDDAAVAAGHAQLNWLDGILTSSKTIKELGIRGVTVKAETIANWLKSNSSLQASIHILLSRSFVFKFRTQARA